MLLSGVVLPGLLLPGVLLPGVHARILGLVALVLRLVTVGREVSAAVRTLHQAIRVVVVALSTDHAAPRGALAVERSG